MFLIRFLRESNVTFMYILYIIYNHKNIITKIIIIYIFARRKHINSSDNKVEIKCDLLKPKPRSRVQIFVNFHKRCIN